VGTTIEDKGHETEFSLKTPIITVVAIVCLVFILLGYSLSVTVREANKADQDRAKLAVGHAITSKLQQIMALATDNAEWNEAARAYYGSEIDEEFAGETWRDLSVDSEDYDTVMVVRDTGDALIDFEKGETTGRDYRKIYGPAYKHLIDRVVKGQNRVNGIIKAHDGVRIVGMTRIQPSDAALSHIIAGKRPIILVFTRKIDAKLLAQIGKSLVISKLTLQEKETDRGVVQHDALGKVVGYLDWEHSNPGNTALEQSLPLMATGFFIFLLISGFLARFGFRAVRQLNRSALIDHLSQLPNRRALRQMMRKAIDASDSVALAFIDLDGFKGLNDNFGHATGDELIQQAAIATRDAAADCEMAVRLGGDEFAIVAIGANAQKRLDCAVDNLLKRFHQPFRLGERAFSIGASIGCVMNYQAELPVHELTRRADIAMYESKRRGKMRKTWYSEKFDQMQAEAHEMEMRIRAGLETDAFDVNYQTIVDAKTSDIVAVEALLRWRDVDGNMIPPDDFIPVAEEAGLINALGLFVLRRACADAISWPQLELAVNLSTVQLRNPDFPGQLKQILNETGFDPHRLKLEITETYLLWDPETARRALEEIRALGVKIAMDDFGTGFASIGFLRQFKFDTLKLDRSLIADAALDEASRALVQASIVVARAMNMTVVAEGVETENQAILMRVAGCDYLQGWYFSEAQDAGRIDSLFNIQSVVEA
jgi:diguanylate cyclase (GGDEF)-like protein